MLLTWGYHHIFHGRLTRSDLDKISTTRPIVVWHRSAHEFILNTKALATVGVDEAFVSAMSESARTQSKLEDGHFWEGGMFAIVPKLLPAIATPERFKAGLDLAVKYYHANGVTLGSEPGGLYSRKLQEAQNAVLSGPDTPFRYYFIPDGKSIFAMFPDTTITETEKRLGWGRGMISPGRRRCLESLPSQSLRVESREEPSFLPTRPEMRPAMRPRAKVISKTMDLDTVMPQKRTRTGTASAF